MLSLKSNIFSFPQKNVKFTEDTLLTKPTTKFRHRRGQRSKRAVSKQQCPPPPFFFYFNLMFPNMDGTPYLFLCMRGEWEVSVWPHIPPPLMVWGQCPTTDLLLLSNISILFWIFIFVVDYFQQLWRELFLCGCSLTKEIYHQNRNGPPWIRYSKIDGRISS